jgi:hypothetical protein
MPSDAFKRPSGPADGFEIWEFAICPFLDMFTDVFEVVFGFELEKFFASRVYDADFAIVKVDFIIFVNHTHVVSWHSVRWAQNHVNVFAVA